MSGDTTIQEVITSVVMHAGAIKHIDLVLICLEDQSVVQSSILKAISELIMSDSIKRLEYRLPNSAERRAIYFPAMTKID